MARRPRKIKKKTSRKLFTKTARKVNRRNRSTGPMRGGIRM